MQNFKIIIFLLLFYSGSLFSQSINGLIIEKFKKDINYSNLWLVETKKKVNTGDKGIALDSLINMRGDLVYLYPSRKNDTYTYEFYFMKGTKIGDPVIPVVLKEKHEECVRNARGDLDCKVTSNNIIFQPKDFVNLKYENPAIYNIVVDFLASQPATPFFNYFKFDEKPDKTARDNSDYIKNERINSDFFFYDSTYKEKDVYVDLSFSKLTFSITEVTKALGFAGFGFEISTGDKILHLLPYQTPYLGWGGSLLINFGGNDQSLSDNFFVDMKILVKSRLDNYSFIKDIDDNLSPIYEMGTPLLNINNGFIIDVASARFYDKLPFVSLYFSSSARDFKKPYKTFWENGATGAYFATQEMEAALSHYFNLDAKGKNKIKLGLGAGAYQINKVIYDNNMNVIFTDQIMGWKNITPVVYFDYTYQGTNASTEPMFGIQSRFFDNRLSFNLWLKIVKTENFELRLEDIFASDPAGRSRRNWEVRGGNFVQLRTRFSF